MHRALIIIGLLVAGVAANATQEIDEVTAAKVKAAYLYNFARFVKWPGDAFEDEQAPIVIGVVGRDPFGAVLDPKKGTIGFHINHGVAKQAELHISSKVLKLADIVESRPKKRA